MHTQFMSQHENPSQPPAPSSQQHVGYAPNGYPPHESNVQPHSAGGPPVTPTKKSRNTIGLIALIVAAVGFVFACIPGALIVGWVLLPIAFILSIVSFFQRDKGKGLGIAALIVSVVGTIVGVIVFFAVVASSFEQAFSEDTNVVAQPAADPEPAAEVSEDATEASPEAAPQSDAGTRDNPLPIGSTIATSDWTVTVDAYNADGNATVAAANQFNEAPASGFHYEIVTYTVTYTGDESDYAMMVGVDLVTSAGNVIDSTSSMAALEDSIGMDELFNGASTSGSQAFLVPDGESALIRVRPGMFADEVFVQP